MLIDERNRSELEIYLLEREICEQNHIVATTKRTDKIKEGWQEKPKGLSQQVLWEQGLTADASNLKAYPALITGKKDDLVGTVDKNSTSLRHIMGMCHDFLKEVGMLQHIATILGVAVLLTPK